MVTNRPTPTRPVPAIALAANGALLNSEFFPGIFPDATVETGGILAASIGLSIAIIAGWDIIDGIVKTYRAGRPPAGRA